MKLKKKDSIEIFEAVVLGSVDFLEENVPLANLLQEITSETDLSVLGSDKFKKFANGMINSFIDDGLIDMRRSITALGQEIVSSKKNWRSLSGQFKILVACRDRSCYIVDITPNYTGECEGFKLEKNQLDFSGTYTNNHGKCIRNAKFEQSWYVSKKTSVDMASCYDYGLDQNVYEIVFNDRKYIFNENVDTFKLVDNFNAKELLRESMLNYNGFYVNGGKIYVRQFIPFPLIENCVDTFFYNGSFNHEGNGYEIEGIKLSTEHEHITQALLMRYLCGKAEKEYLGYNEIGNLTMGFYSLFEEVAEVGQRNNQICLNLVDYAKSHNMMAMLRLQAYIDLMPEELSRKFSKTSIDLSNSRLSINDVVKNFFGKQRDIVAITTATQYACKNIGISRNMLLMSKAIEAMYDVPLTLKSCYDPNANDLAKDYYKNLTNAQSVEHYSVSKDKISTKIHDRYYLVERTNGEKEWYKMSGEMDAIRYDRDFINGMPREDITEETIGYIKEMTITPIDEMGVIENVKTLLGGC